MAFFDVRLCGREEVVVVDGGSFSPATGQIYELNGSRGEIYCGEILGESVESSALYTAATQYDTCLICVTASSESNYYVFEDCNNEASTINVSPLEFETATSLGNIPNIGDVFDITYNDGKGNIISTCFKFREVVYTVGAVITVTLVSVTPYSLCSLCNWETNSVVVEVERCGHPDEFYYVQIPIGAGPFISFIPIGESPDQYCGEIIQVSEEPPTGIFLSSFGGCSECEAQTQVKRELISCIDGSIEVVFASALYGVGETGFVKTIDPEVNLATCYEIGSITTEPVTIISYLEYFPSQSCDECFSCNPIGIEYAPCNGEGETYTATTYQFVGLSQTFLHPIVGCCVVTNYFEPINGSEIIYSFTEFNGDCESGLCLQHDYETWLVETCFSEFEIPTYGYVSVPPNVFTTGDTTMIKVGLYDDFCVTFLSDTEEIPYNFVGITNEVNYGDCPTCLEQRTRGVIIVNCRTNEELKVKMYESQIQQIGGGVFTDEQLNCYYLFDDCNKDDSTPLFNAFLLYETCPECINPKSANTPTTICVICCDCGATGSTVNIVTPPYPTWTDQYGKAVVQTNMVVIGGNGLNG